MILKYLKKINAINELLEDSQLYNEKIFYRTFLKDLSNSKSEVIIECPFITTTRLATISPILKLLKRRRVKVVVHTRSPREHHGYMRTESELGVDILQEMGVQVILTSGHHRKIAVLDRKVLWEGSLNILSQNNSQEMMRRIVSEKLSWQMIRFTELDQRMN